MDERTLGIDAIAIAAPEGYVELAELAEARGVPPAKYVEGLGVTRMAVARAHEDPVALAANAARRLFERSGANPSDVGLCVVGTETAVDHSKPIAAFLHGLLGLPSSCRVYEAKHACFGGTAGLMTALDWLASGSARGRSALVVCTDIARYELGTAGEPTQGAGAVALLVTERPRLVAIDPRVTGSYARDVSDFWRPLDRKDAIVDGQHSVQCYLDALAGAYAEHRQIAAARGQGESDVVRRCYHVPYGKMARKAHRHLAALRGLDEAEADASYAREVASSLRFPSVVGNVYTGSLYLALASMLDADAATIEGQSVGLFSYGSGCCAESFSGRVVEGAGAFAAELALGAPLEGRTRLSIPEYEAIRRADATAERALRGAASEERPGGRTSEVAFLGIESERRLYG
jgi:hydroxymethylglutaryl-CoA synthase